MMKKEEGNASEKRGNIDDKGKLKVDMTERNGRQGEG